MPRSKTWRFDIDRDEWHWHDNITGESGVISNKDINWSGTRRLWSDQMRGADVIDMLPTPTPEEVEIPKELPKEESRFVKIIKRYE